MEGFKIAMAGGFGGIAPSLIDHAHELQSGAFAKWLGNGNDFLISLLSSLGAMALFFIIGSAVALIYRETVLSKAMILGIGAPALIMAAAASGVGGPKQVEVGNVHKAGWITGAHAQDMKTSDKAFDLTVKSVANGMDCASCSVQVLGVDNSLLSVQSLDSVSGETIVEIPEGANSIVFTGKNTNSILVVIQELVDQSSSVSSAPVLDIERDRNYWNDVQRSLGVRSIEPYDFTVKLQD